MRLISVLHSSLNLQRGYLFPWVPVCLAIGIGIYFTLLAEPSQAVWTALSVTVLLFAVVGWCVPDAIRPVFIGVLLVLIGFLIAGFRAHDVAETKLAFRYYGPIEGRIVAIDRSQSDAVRLTLDRVRLKNMRPKRTPAHARVSLHGQQGYFVPEPGQVVVLTGHLSPPGGPVEPGGYDFQRQAWFQGLGAVGYTRTPALLWRNAEVGGTALALYRFRMKLSRAVREALPGRAGAFAAAITTGDRSGLDRADLDALRASNLAHLLAISGLHMGLLTGFVFAAVRIGLALIPRLSLFYPIRKVAAVVALMTGAAYLALSGGNVATERAFIMVAVMFGAVLTDRRAITLRAVAVAAAIVLILRPETLYGPGFQMSFAATTALVAVYGWMRDIDTSTLRFPRPVRLLAGVALSSAIAGAATAPIAAAHFNQVPHYGLVANILSVPLMGAIIMPGAVLAAVLAPFGLAIVGLKLMEMPILWILAVAETVQSWPSALSFVVAPQSSVLPILALGALWSVLWQGRLRSAGLPAVIASFFIWSQAERPTLLVSDTGGLIGITTPEGRALSKDRGESFAAMSWLENDGDPSEQTVASRRRAWVQAGRVRFVKLGSAQVIHGTGKSVGAQLVQDCEEADLVIVNIRVEEYPETCRIIDTGFLRENGAVAIEPSHEGLSITTVRDKSGLRLWSQ